MKIQGLPPIGRRVWIGQGTLEYWRENGVVLTVLEDRMWGEPQVPVVRVIREAGVVG